MGKKERVKELVKILNEAGKAYYSESREIMSNLEYDRLYDELTSLEKETGIVLSESPTVNVGYTTANDLVKERHSTPMLSLDKTKDPQGLKSFLKDHSGVISWKLDGITVVLTYRNGSLFKAVTRGNGLVGEVITDNARVFENIPLSIPFKGELVLRGEALIRYSDFERINRTIVDDTAKYKNPRNLCAGSVRALNNEITAERCVNFIAFALISAEGIDFKNSEMNRFAWLADNGFDVVEHYLVRADDIDEMIRTFKEAIRTSDLPSDGLVLIYDDIEYGLSLGSTAKFPRNGIAFKWADEQAVTTLREIEWNASRTGLINPVAVFDGVELEGTSVQRASVHNISIMEQLCLGIGDEITVYKANMIIPQISGNLTKSGNMEIPDECPSCGKKTVIKNENGVKTLHCENPDCPAKHIKSFSLFVERDALNITGLSEETLEKFIDAGYIKEFSDIYKLERFKDEIVNKKGFGVKSYEKLIKSIEASRDVSPASFVYALGIPNVGIQTAKLLCSHFDGSLSALMSAPVSELVNVEGIGDLTAAKIRAYFDDENNMARINRLLDELNVKNESGQKSGVLSGLTFVITGSLEKFKNRSDLKNFIESMGGKTSESVSKNTSYLINNNPDSSSSKNKKAAGLGVRIINEDEFMAIAKEKQR